MYGECMAYDQNLADAEREAKKGRVLADAVTTFLNRIDFDMVCGVCEPSEFGGHRDGCPAVALDDALRAFDA